MQFTYKFRYEPIVSRLGHIMALEMLTTLSDKVSGTAFPYSKLRTDEKIFIFENQLSVAEKMGSFLDEGVKLTLNVDVECGLFISSDFSLRRRISLIKKYLRLEVSENFNFSTTSPDKRVLRNLSETTQLWLDDFGSGYTSISSLAECKFEIVKIDKVFFWENESKTHAISYLIDTINEYCNGVIIEGVDSVARDQIANRMNVYGKQGYLWRARKTCQLYKN